MGRRGAIVSWLAALLLSPVAGCEIPPRDNPIDPVNLLGGGDPYEMALGYEEGAVVVRWRPLTVDGLVGYWVYRVEDAGDRSTAELAAFVDQPHEGDTTANGYLIYRDERPFPGWATIRYYLRPQGADDVGEPSAIIAFAPGGDIDGDGSADDDCVANSATIFPGAAEVCDGLDDDCDGLTDEDGVCNGR